MNIIDKNELQMISATKLTLLSVAFISINVQTHIDIKIIYFSNN